jgi:GNAT superfamily N-acetyltransferase
MSAVLQDLSAPALAAAVERSHWEFYDYLSRSPRGRHREDATVQWVMTGIPHPMFNGVFGATLPCDGVEAAIEEAMAPFKAHHVPMCWWTGPSTRPADLGERLEAHGLRRAEDLPGMAMDLAALNDALPEPSGLAIEPVTGQETLKEFVDLFAYGFRFSDRVRDALFDCELALGFGPRLPWRRYLGRLSGELVAISGMFLGAPVAVIECVATLPGARRQGVGTAMTRAPLREARAIGYRVGVLTATPMGCGVYRRLGFHPYCDFVTYAWAEDNRWYAGPLDDPAIGPQPRPLTFGDGGETDGRAGTV